MTKIIEGCPVCGEQFREHTGNMGYVIRGHIRRVHPEAEAEIKQAEIEVRDTRKRIEGKYPNVYFSNYG